jgi:predicted esterase
MIVETIRASIHGRYLVVPPLAATPPPPLLVGFHGYGEAVDAELDRLRAIAPDGDWLIVSVQALHRFYLRRSQQVVASWMTSQDRELAIADNIAYVGAVIETVSRRYSVASTRVVSGFSQGVAMAFRAAAALPGSTAAVVACGGDVPPEIDPSSLARVSVLLGRGTGDDWYTIDKLRGDVARLRGAGVDVTPIEFDGGHQWAPPFIEAARDFLQRCR